MRTPNLPLSSQIVLSCAIALLVSTAAAAAEPVYKWKDSNGQSHYSQTPPPGQKYETITPAGVTANASSATAASASPSASTSTKLAAPATVSPGLTLHQKNCTTALNNVAVLKSNPTADLDTKGTGRPVRVTPEQRATELDRANKLVTQYCGK